MPQLNTLTNRPQPPWMRRSAGPLFSPITVIFVVLIVLLLATACSSDPAAGPDGAVSPTPGTSSTGTTGTDGSSTGTATSSGATTRLSPASFTDGTPGIDVTLQSGVATPDTDEASEPITGEPLADDAVDAILTRVDALTSETGDQVDFNRPVETRPPPLVGETISQPFPLVETTDAPPVDRGPLEVLRVQPEGDVQLAPSMSITFNQPMVPLATLEQLDALDVPVRMTPELPGRWQWIGTKTLRFEHDPTVRDRLPQATEYVVEVPAGTTSATGGTLNDTVSFTFRTPPVEVTSLRPQREGLPLDQIFLATFNQDIDRDAILAITRLWDDGTEYEIRPATPEELEAQNIRPPDSEAMANRWIAFRAVELLPTSADLLISIGPDIPSTEGPRRNGETYSFTARTYDPLRIREHDCNWSRDCIPLSGMRIAFNNEIDPESFDPAAFTIEPALEDAEVTLQYNDVRISGLTRGTTTYRVTVPAGIADTFGQQLGESPTLEFRFGEAPPVVVPFSRELTTLDPLSDDKSVSVGSINHEELTVEIYAVEAADFLTFRSMNHQEMVELPFTRLDQRVLDLDAEDDELTLTRIDLADHVDAGHNQMVVFVRPRAPFDGLTPESRDYWANRPTAMWVQSTTIGLDAFTDGQQLLAWTTDLRDGSTLTDVALTLFDSDGREHSAATTTADGVAPLEMGPQRNRLIHARLGDDEAILPGSWRSGEQSPQLRWYVIDDRSIYRPGETVSMKGWVRRAVLGADPRLDPIASGSSIQWVANDWNGNELATGDAAIEGLGGFDFTWDVPLDATLGPASIGIQLDDGSGGGTWHQVELQEFRRPEFEVTARNETEGPYFVDTTATVAVDAKYFAGGGLPSADTDWWVTTTNTTYRPPNWDEFSFGEWRPWWGYFDDDHSSGNDGQQFTGRTDASGSHYLELSFAPGENPRPVVVSARATVMDVNRQAWDSTTSLLVHAADTYVGLRSPTAFVRQGEPMVVEAIAVDIDGAPAVGGPINMTMVRLEWKWVDGSWTQVESDPEGCTIDAAGEPGQCVFNPMAGGRHRITAVVEDSLGRRNQSTLTRWVSGGTRPRSPGVTQEELTLVPNLAEYQPGDTAEVLVEAPFSTGTGQLTIAHDGIVGTVPFAVVDGSAVVQIPITEAMQPNVHLLFDLAGSAVRTSADGTEFPDIAPRPAFATGQLELAVPPTRHILSIDAQPATDALEPGDRTSLTVTVVDANGQPVPDAEVAVIVVDEAILALSGYELADPITAFHRPTGSNVSRTYGRNSIVLTDPAAMSDLAKSTAAAGDASDAAEESAAMADDGDFAGEGANRLAQGAPAGAAIDVRSNFDPLANFSPAVTTDGNGTATVDYTVPDNLTRYRVMVVAAAGVDQFGSTESNITARLPLMVRPSAPRFLNFGDQFELPIVVQNQTDEDRTVDVVVDGTNLVFDGGRGQQVLVPANDRVELRFPARADQAGTARFQAVAVSGDLADAATVSLPVYTPATTEAFATYGVVDSGVTAQPILAPVGVFPQVGGLEVTTSSTAVQALTDSVLYLHEYRYASADGLASRIVAVSALDDVLGAFAADGLPAPDELRTAVQADIEALAALQNWDGGWAYWSRNNESVPYVSLHATHALVEATKSGYVVPPETLAMALDYTRNIEQHLQTYEWYSVTARDSVIAYAIHILNLARDPRPDWAAEVWQRSGDRLPLEAMAWLWPLLPEQSETIERAFNNQVTETAAGATFTTSYGEDSWVLLHSNRRTDAIILESLVSQRPDSDLIPKIVNGLLAGQTRGRWNNAQENSFILLALNRYFTTFEATTPDFIARVWLGDVYAAEHQFQGRSVDSLESTVTTSELIAEGDTDIVISKEGDGRLYYRLGVRYAPDDLVLDPLDRGFVVQRTYEGVERADDVYLDDDGVWHVRAGAEVRVRVTMINDSRRTHVALIDPLPAGLEPLNPELATTADRPNFGDDEGDFWQWNWTWYNHQNLRDDRAEAFSERLRAGSWDYSYVARATTPGTFVVPPTTAEEIFAPEVFGRSASAIVIVE